MNPSCPGRSSTRASRLAAALSAALVALLVSASAEAQEISFPDDTPTPALEAGDFVLSLWSSKAATGADAALIDEDILGRFFDAHRCHCPTNLIALVELSEAGKRRIGARTANVDLFLGPAATCAASAAGCTAVGGSMAISAAAPQNAATFRTDAVFASAGPGAACGALGAGQTDLVAKVSGTTVVLSLPLALQPDPLPAPAGVAALPADGGLLVSWKAAGGSAAGLVAGYQVLCAPRLAQPTVAAFERCDAEPTPSPSGGVSLGEAAACSPFVAAPATSVRVNGLVNAAAYEVAVVAVDGLGAVSPVSGSVIAAPAPTLDFYDHYRRTGGSAPACAFAGARGGGGFLPFVVLALAAWAWRQRRLALASAVVCGALGLAGAAHAQTGPTLMTYEDVRADHPGSPRDWDFALRFGPYRPDVDIDGQLAGAKPFADTFGSGRRLMTRMELGHHLAHRFGTSSIAFGLGHYTASAAAWAADGTGRSGDETTLTLMPLSVSLGWRADATPWIDAFPLAPYVKAGLDLALWQSARTGGAAAHRGFTPGWHAAAGVALRLDFLDRSAARALDDELGLNHTSVFFEWERARIDGLGMTNGLRLGDSTWAAGVLFEL